MKPILRICLGLAAATSLSACTIATRSYVEPTYHKATADAIHPLAAPIAVRVTAHFQTNGAGTPGADNALQQHLQAALLASGVFVPTEDSTAAASIEVTANDTSDLQDAHHRGFHTGLTFGSKGSTIDDGYDFTFVYRDANGTDYQASYKHLIHTTIGNNVVAPAGAAATSPADAFHKVVEDVTMNFVWDLQSQGRLPH